MLAPQSDEEIRPVVEALRRLDPLLDIRWNPRCFRAKGTFDGLGIPSPERWECRWEVIRYETPNMHVERNYSRILVWTEREKGATYPRLIHEGPYVPVSFQLVEYMELWNAASRCFDEAMEAAWAAHERAEEIQHADYTAGHQEAADKVFYGAGGRTAIGGAQGKAAPETVAGLYGKGRRSVDALATSTP